MTDQPTPPKPTALQVKAALDNLANAQAKLTVLMLELTQLKDSVIPADVKVKLADIDAEYQDKIDAANKAVSTFDENAKQMVATYGESVKGTFLHGVYNPGKVTWQNKELDGYAVAHPEIKEFRKQGKPYTTIKPIEKA